MNFKINYACKSKKNIVHVTSSSILKVQLNMNLTHTSIITYLLVSEIGQKIIF